VGANSLKDEGLPPEENVLHGLATGLGIKDPIQIDLTKVLLLGLKVAGLHDPECELCVEATQVVPVWPTTVVQAGEREREGSGVIRTVSND